MIDTVILGAGGLAREMELLLEQLNAVEQRFNLLGYLVSEPDSLGDRDSKDKVIGDLTWFEGHPEPVAAVVGIGTPAYRLSVGRQVASSYLQVEFPVLIHPSVSYDPKSCRFERGTVVCANSTLTVNITAGEFSLLNIATTVGHETKIGAGCVANPGANLAGGLDIGEGVLVGAGASVLQYLTLHDGCTVGAGACVTRDVPAKTTVVGVPAKPLNRG